MQGEQVHHSEEDYEALLKKRGILPSSRMSEKDENKMFQQ